MAVTIADQAGADRCSTAADIEVLYRLIFGRRPENPAVYQERIGRTIKDVAEELLSSAEFAALIGLSLGIANLPHHQNLDRRDLRRVENWLKDQGATLPEGETGIWWAIVGDFVERHAMGLGLIHLDQWLELASKMRSVACEPSHSLRSFLEFDPGWYVKANAAAAAGIATRQYDDAEAYFLRAGRYRGDQLLPAFTGDLASLYAGVATEAASLEPFVTAIASAAQSGELAHWLFDPLHYLQRRTAKFPDEQVTPRRTAYVEFLSWGDEQEIGPHPLFCHHAYRVLNGVSDANLYSHYLQHGVFAGHATSAIFDRDYYLAANPEARSACDKGGALQHFLKFGLARDYPFCPDFDARFYASYYPDVAELVDQGSIPSATWHFVFRGLSENRRPNGNFDPEYYLQRHPHVASEMLDLGIASALEHFLLIGRASSFEGERPLIKRQPSLEAGKIIFFRRAMRSLDRLATSPLDFTSFRTPKPSLSLIVPVCGEVAFTAHFLQCAYYAAFHLHAHRGLGTEIIVVNNGSRDLTATLLAATPGIKTLNFPEPIGYPRAINAGTVEADGEFIIVANNDVEFPPDTLERGLDHLDNPEIGIIGPMVILPDETLQEVGSYVDRRGGIVGVGRYENPWDDYFRGVHDVDYCSGCFFGFRKADFEALGGADESFTPGYYEDTDLAFRMREQLGKRTLVAPDMQVVHFEHASFGKGRPPTTALATIKKNQQRFARKHAEVLKSHPLPAELAKFDHAKPAGVGRTRMLVILQRWPENGAGEESLSELLERLRAKAIGFDLFLLNASPAGDEYGDPRLSVYRAWVGGEEPTEILRRSSWRYSHIWIQGTLQQPDFVAEVEGLRRVYGVRILRNAEEVLATFGLAQ